VAARLFVALAPALLWTVGGLSVQLLLPAPLERSRLARLALGFLIGCAGTALTAWSLGFAFGLPLDRPAFVLFPSLALALGIATAIRRGDLGGLAPSRPSRRAGRRALLAAPLLLVGAASAALLLNALVEPVIDFDGRMTWGTAAKYLVAEGKALPEALTDPARYVIHPRYPILMPLLAAGSVRLGGGEVEGDGVRPLYTLFLPALLAVLAPAVLRRGGLRAGVLALLLVASVPALLWERETGARGTFSDLPLGAFLAGGLSLLLHPRLRDEPGRGWVAGLLLAAAAGCKNEGLVLAPAAALAATLAWRLHPGQRSPGLPAGLRRAVLVTVLGVAFVALWQSRIPNRNDEDYFDLFSPLAAARGLVERAGEIAVRAGAQAFDPRRAGILFWSLPPLLLAGGRALGGRAVAAATVLLAVEAVLAATAYALVDDLRVVDVTWLRFAIQLYLPAALVIAAVARGAMAAARGRP